MKEVLILILFVSLSLVSAEISYKDCSVYGNCKSETPSINFNNNTLNVNNSNFLGGYPYSAFFPFSNTTGLSDIKWGYNQSLVLNLTYNKFWYNQTLGAWTITGDQSGLTGTKSGTFNIETSGSLEGTYLTDGVMSITGGSIVGGVGADFGGTSIATITGEPRITTTSVRASTYCPPGGGPPCLTTSGTSDWSLASVGLTIAKNLTALSVFGNNICNSNGTGCNVSLINDNTNHAMTNQSNTFTGNQNINGWTNITNNLSVSQAIKLQSGNLNFIDATSKYPYGLYDFREISALPTGAGTTDYDYPSVQSIHTLSEANAYAVKIYNDAYSTSIPLFSYFGYNNGDFLQSSFGTRLIFGTNGFIGYNSGAPNNGIGIGAKGEAYVYNLSWVGAAADADYLVTSNKTGGLRKTLNPIISSLNTTGTGTFRGLSVIDNGITFQVGSVDIGGGTYYPKVSSNTGLILQDGGLWLYDSTTDTPGLHLYSNDFTTSSADITLNPSTGVVTFTNDAGTAHSWNFVGTLKTLDLQQRTTFGLRIGATTDKLGFFGVSPVVKQSSTTELGTVLSNLGLRTVGSNYSINTSGNITGNTYYGEIYNKSYTGWTLDLVTTNVYVNLTNFVNGRMNGIDGQTNQINITQAGTYEIFWKIDFEGNGEYGTNIAVNGIRYDTCYALGSAGVTTHQHHSNTCILKLNAGDYITLQMDDHQNPVNDPTIHDSKLNVHWVGN